MDSSTICPGPGGHPASLHPSQHRTALICIYRDVVTSRCRTKWPILSPAARHSSEFYRGTAAITADSVKNNEFLPVILIEGEPRNRQQELSSSESVKYFLIDHTNWWWLPGPGLGTIRLPLQRSYSAEGRCAQQTCEQCMTMLYNTKPSLISGFVSRSIKLPVTVSEDHCWQAS